MSKDALRTHFSTAQNTYNRKSIAQIPIRPTPLSISSPKFDVGDRQLDSFRHAPITYHDYLPSEYDSARGSKTDIKSLDHSNCE